MDWFSVIVLGSTAILIASFLFGDHEAHQKHQEIVDQQHIAGINPYNTMKHISKTEGYRFGDDLVQPTTFEPHADPTDKSAILDAIHDKHREVMVDNHTWFQGRPHRPINPGTLHTKKMNIGNPLPGSNIPGTFNQR